MFKDIQIGMVPRHLAKINLDPIWKNFPSFWTSKDSPQLVLQGIQNRAQKPQFSSKDYKPDLKISVSEEHDKE